MATQFIKVWTIRNHTHVDLVNGMDHFPVFYFWHKDYPTSLEDEISYKVRRLQDMTGFAVKNETDLNL